MIDILRFIICIVIVRISFSIIEAIAEWLKKHISFKPKTLRYLLITIDQYCEELEKLVIKEDDNTIMSGIAIDSLKEEVKKFVNKNYKEIKTSIITSNSSPNIIVLRAFFNHSRNKVISGNFHIYRSTLNDTGRTYYRISKESLKALVKLRDVTKKEADIIKKEMKADILFEG